jgi:hypothetical protein
VGGWRKRTSLVTLFAVGALALVVLFIVETRVAEARYEHTVQGLRARTDAVTAIKRYHRERGRWPASDREIPAQIAFQLEGHPEPKAATYRFGEGSAVRLITVRDERP